MKFVQEKPKPKPEPFYPIRIELETREEAEELLAVLAMFRDSRSRDEMDLVTKLGRWNVDPAGLYTTVSYASPNWGLKSSLLCRLKAVLGY